MSQKGSLLLAIAMMFFVTACQSSNDGELNSETGMPVYTLSSLAWIDREGNVEAINVPARNYIYAQISPDGNTIALNSRDETSDIWIYDLQIGSMRKLTTDVSSNIGPLWMSDGRLAYTRIYDGKQVIVLQPADLVSFAKPLTILFTSDNNQYPTGFTEDGATLVFHSSPNGYDMWSLSLSGDERSFQSLLSSDARETNGVLSPDGKWLAYESDDSGELEIYASPFPDVASMRVKISRDGGSRPHWNSDGSEVFFIDQYESEQSGAMMVTDFDSGSGSILGAPKLLFEGNFHSPLQGQGRQLYDVSADDQRFLMIQKAQ